jgi:transposase
VTVAQTIPANDWRRAHFIEWLCTPPTSRDPYTYKELAAKLGLGEQTLYKWKRDVGFLNEWEQQYRKVVGSPEKAQEVVERLHETAVDRTDPRQVQAAKAYLEAIDAIRPKKVDITVTTRPAKDLPDDELYALLAEAAQRELQERDGEPA